MERSIDDFLRLDAPRPWVIAHRGFSRRAPENTLVAVRQAIELGADMVEIDVSMSSDGELVVIHDETLDRTTDGTGPVLATPWSVIAGLDAGSWFVSPVGNRFAGERVPTLDQVLATTARRCLLNIEIKTEAVGDASVDEVPVDGIAARLAAAVRERDVVDEVVVSSFDPRALAHLRALAPEIRTASLYARSIHRDMTPREIAGQVGSEGLNVSRSEATAALIEQAHDAGLPVAVYTVNQLADMVAMLDRGADALFTDRPDRMLDLLAERPGRW